MLTLAQTSILGQATNDKPSGCTIIHQKLLLKGSSKTVKEWVTLLRNWFVHPQDQPLSQGICGASLTTQLKYSPKPPNVKGWDFRRNGPTVLLQMSLSWVLLLPGDGVVMIPLGHPPLEGTLNWCSLLTFV